MSMLNEARRGSLTDSRDRSFKGRMREIIPWKGDSLAEVARKLVFIVAVGVLIYSAYTTYVYFFGKSSMINDQKELADIFQSGVVNEQNGQQGNAAADPGTQQQTPGAVDLPNSDPSQQTQPQMLGRFEELYKLNPDVVGWLMIDGINFEDSDEPAINYPVVQGDDNDYYLTHDFMGSEEDYGALFADYRANLTGIGHSSNVTIYGHNMKTEFYFHHIRDYNRTSPTFVSEHRLINFSTLYEESQYIVIGYFFVSTHEEDDNQPLFSYHNCVEFRTMEDFDYWYKNVMYRNYYKTDIDCTIDDEYLTLSTCSFEITDSRYVLVARKLRPGEDPSQYTYETNEDRHMPVKWLKAMGREVTEDDGPDYEYYVPADE